MYRTFVPEDPVPNAEGSESPRFLALGCRGNWSGLSQALVGRGRQATCSAAGLLPGCKIANFTREPFLLVVVPCCVTRMKEQSGVQYCGGAEEAHAGGDQSAEAFTVGVQWLVQRSGLDPWISGCQAVSGLARRKVGKEGTYLIRPPSADFPT